MTQLHTQPAKIGDAVVHEVLDPHEFQHLLRQVGGKDGNLEHVKVEVKSALAPWEVTVSGALYIYGEPHYWETPMDLRAIKSAEDIIQTVGALEASFEKAAAQLRRPA